MVLEVERNRKQKLNIWRKEMMKNLWKKKYSASKIDESKRIETTAESKH